MGRKTVDCGQFFSRVTARKIIRGFGMKRTAATKNRIILYYIIKLYIYYRNDDIHLMERVGMWVLARKKKLKNARYTCSVCRVGFWE